MRLVLRLVGVIIVVGIVRIAGGGAATAARTTRGGAAAGAAGAAATTGGARVDGQGTAFRCSDFIIGIHTGFQCSRPTHSDGERAGACAVRRAESSCFRFDHSSFAVAGGKVAVGHGEGGERSVRGHALVVCLDADRALCDGDADAVLRYIRIAIVADDLVVHSVSTGVLGLGKLRAVAAARGQAVLQGTTSGRASINQHLICAVVDQSGLGRRSGDHRGSLVVHGNRYGDCIALIVGRAGYRNCDGGHFIGLARVVHKGELQGVALHDGIAAEDFFAICCGDCSKTAARGQIADQIHGTGRAVLGGAGDGHVAVSCLGDIQCDPILRQRLIVVRTAFRGKGRGVCSLVAHVGDRVAGETPCTRYHRAVPLRGQAGDGEPAQLVSVSTGSSAGPFHGQHCLGDLTGNRNSSCTVLDLVVILSGAVQRNADIHAGLAAHIGAGVGNGRNLDRHAAVGGEDAGDVQFAGGGASVGRAVIGLAHLVAAGGDGDFLFLHDGVHGRAALMGAALVGRGDTLGGRTGLDSLKRDCFGICIGLYQIEVFSVVIPSPLFVRAGRVTGLRCRQDELLTVAYGSGQAGDGHIGSGLVNDCHGEGSLRRIVVVRFRGGDLDGKLRGCTGLLYSQLIASQADTSRSLVVQRIGGRTGIATTAHARDGCPIGNILGNTALGDGLICGNGDGLRCLTNGKLPDVCRQVVSRGIVVCTLRNGNFDRVVTCVLRFSLRTVFEILHRDSAHAVDAGIRFDRGGLGVSVISQASGRGKGEVACLRVSPLDCILHAGGRIAHRDAGGVLARVDGCGGQRRAILRVGDTAHGGQTGNAAECVKLCCRFLGVAVIGQRIRSGRGNREGPTELIGQIAAIFRTLGGDGRAACRVRPAMLMPGHGERLAEALIAVARYNLDFIRKGLACGQFGNGERLAVGTGIFLSQALRNIRIRKRTPLIIDGSVPGIGQACTLIGCDRHCQRHRGAVLCVEGTAGVVRLAVRIDLCAFDGRWRDSYIVYAGSAILPCAVACFIAISIRQIFIRRNIRFAPFNLFICAAAQAGAAAIVFYGQTHV